MASIFTYDPDPPRISSPWSTPTMSTPRLDPADGGLGASAFQIGGLESPPPSRLAEFGITKLEEEPQEGPTEYKLHLLLRRRRSFSFLSTGHAASGTSNPRPRPSQPEAALEAARNKAPPNPTPTTQSRQNRLEHLTTQLLWRLQQSSPYHSSSTADLVMPRLPETVAELGASVGPEKLLPGLEESRGALYELGVGDDGAFVGLTREELDESLKNLRAMAASLGCKAEILRCVIVGECEWTESASNATTSKATTAEAVRHEDLFVTEVLILPDTDVRASIPTLVSRLVQQSNTQHASPAAELPAEEDSCVDQLRVSLTGATTSGKSSLLGTLSTSTLDNGRGKSRLSLLKHRHEIVSGVTSSVAPELIGYQSAKHKNSKQSSSVVNYGCGNVSSWNDIHNAADGGRLVFLIDSAGHPRYRRTTVRGLVSWAPHWTLCCVAADDRGGAGSNTAPLESLGIEVHPALSKAHLELCLKLELSLVVVITKYDLASKPGLRQTLARVLSIVKDAGRKPVMLKPRPPAGAGDVHSLSAADEQEILSVVGEPNVVPIVLTSAVTGDGIGKLHTLLMQLPIPAPATGEPPTSLDTLFHIDEVYIKPAVSTLDLSSHVNMLLVASGHLRYGTLSIGDTLQLGPFAQTRYDTLPVDMHRARSYPSRLPTTSSPGTLPRRISGDFGALSLYDQLQADFISVKVVSVRNLRLPLRRLKAGQAGTVGIELSTTHSGLVNRVRKGMVLGHPRADHQVHLTSCAGLVARFGEDVYHVMQPGVPFNVYVASVRAAAKIISVDTLHDNDEDPMPAKEENGHGHGSEGIFGFDEEHGSGVEDTNRDRHNGTGRRRFIDVAFQLVACREWIEVGAQVLVMPANVSESGVGLDGFVGKVMEVLE